MDGDLKRAAAEMAEEQLIARGISDSDVLKAMLKVPREAFVPEEHAHLAYDDRPLPIGEGQTISQPYIVALMTQLLGLTGVEKVLEIGTGSGYQTAILAELSKEVYTVERIASLGDRAKIVLDKMGYKNIKFLVSDGTLGWPEYAPYDRIIATAASADLPQPFIEQLADGGRIVIPLGDRFSQVLTVYDKKGAGVTKKETISCVFVPLIGKHGFHKI
jgi:protein-L-isoaspartate(D-aspartate) O-methyltransferase